MSTSLAKAEERARRAGYRGSFPPAPKPRVDTADQFEGLVGQVLTGDRRANLLWQVAVHAGEFFHALQPDHCSQLATVLVKLAEDPETPRRVRIRAIQAAIRPLIALTARARKLQRVPAGDQTLLGELEQNIAAFIGSLATNPEDSKETFPPLVRLAQQLFTIGTTTTEKGREDQVRAISTAMDLITHMMDAIIAVRGDLSEQAARSRSQASPQEIEAARRQLTQLEADVRAKLEQPQQQELSHDLADQAGDVVGE
ncbi:MAG: hypothetical protein KAU28_01155 [Phycisphaerae bacterium]|nr:hypothetical protein [Phycisphaerae bacterium]